MDEVAHRVRHLEKGCQVEYQLKDHDPFVEPEQYGCPRPLPRPKDLNLFPSGDDELIEDECWFRVIGQR